jgi:RNA polymerase sigma factor (sigma-70 family)
VEAAARVLAEHGGFIRAVIRFQCDDEARLEDLYQEFFLRLIRRPLPPDLDNVRAYLYRSIAHDVFDSARSQERYRHILQKYSKKIRISINKRTSTNAFIETEASDSLFGLLARHLPKRQSQAVTMRYRDDFSLAEIAAEMGVNPRTVSRYISSGLKRLKGVLAIE